MEHTYGLFGGGLVAVDGQRGTDDLLHPLTQVGCIVGGQGTANTEVDIIAVADGDVDAHPAFRPEVVGSLCQHEEEAPGEGPYAAGTVQVEKLDGLLLVGAVVHALHLIIDVGGDGAVFHLET